MIVARGEAGTGRAPPGTAVLVAALVAAPLAAGAVVAATRDLDATTASILAFFVVAVGVAALPPRGLAVSRTWVVGYLVLQFPLRAIFLLSEPLEPPPIFKAWAPGAGLEPMLALAMAQAAGALAILGVAYAVTSWSTSRAPVDPEADIDRRRFAVMLALAVAMLPIELRSARGEATGGGDFIVALPGLAVAGASASISYAFARKPAAHVAPFAIALAYNFVRVALLSSKLSLLAASLALIIGFSTRTPARAASFGRSVRNVLVAAALVVGASYAFAAAVPSGDRGAIGPSVMRGAANAVSRSYGVDALLAVNGYLDAGGQLDQGASLVSLAWSWVPRSVWPDKPKSFSVEFGERVFSFSSIAGESYFAPGYFGELVMNFGPVGLLIAAISFGVALAVVDRMRSMPQRVLWLIVLVHLVEGSIVAQFWLAAPFLVGGYAVLARSGRSPSADMQDSHRTEEVTRPATARAH